MKYILLAISVFFTDIYLKNRAEHWVEISEDAPKASKAPSGAMRPLFIPRKVHNYGLAMGAFQKHSEKVTRLSLGMTIAFGVIFLAAVLKRPKESAIEALAGAEDKSLSFLIPDKPSALYKTSLALQMGGAASNTYDRLSRGYVVDYFSFNVPGKVGEIAFNMGDIALVVGAVLEIFGKRGK